MANISAAYKILPGLEYKFLYSINNSVGVRNTNTYGFIPGISSTGIGDISNARLTSQLFTHTLTYNTQLTKNLHFDALAGFEYFKI